MGLIVEIEGIRQELATRSQIEHLYDYLGRMLHWLDARPVLLPFSVSAAQSSAARPVAATPPAVCISSPSPKALPAPATEKSEPRVRDTRSPCTFYSGGCNQNCIAEGRKCASCSGKATWARRLAKKANLEGKPSEQPGLPVARKEIAPLIESGKESASAVRAGGFAIVQIFGNKEPVVRIFPIPASNVILSAFRYEQGEWEYIMEEDVPRS